MALNLDQFPYKSMNLLNEKLQRCIFAGTRRGPSDSSIKLFAGLRCYLFTTLKIHRHNAKSTSGDSDSSLGRLSVISANRRRATSPRRGSPPHPRGRAILSTFAAQRSGRATRRGWRGARGSLQPTLSGAAAALNRPWTPQATTWAPVPRDLSKDPSTQPWRTRP